MIIYLDMDGVIVDTMLAVAQLYGVSDRRLASWPKGEYNVSKALRLPHFTWAGLEKFGSSWWRDLPESPDFRDLLTSLRVLGQVIFCSSPGDTPSSLTGKVQWLHHRFGDKFNDYVITHHKYLLARPEAVLVDDYQKNVDDFQRNGGHAVLVPRPWNTGELVDGDTVADHVSREVRRLGRTR